MDKRQQLTDLLNQLEKQMQQWEIWQMPEPSEQALASKEPFCVDTMGFDQWVRFVMLVRFRQMLEQDLPLPCASQIAPMAEVFYQTHDNQLKQGLIQALEAIDACLTGE